MKKNKKNTDIAALKAMSAKERYEFLKDKEIEIDAQTFIDGDAKIGDPNAAFVMYRARISCVALTGWGKDKAEILKIAQDHILRLAEAAEEEEYGW